MSDETLMGYSIFLSMVAAALLVFLSLGVFAWNESASLPTETPAQRRSRAVEDSPPGQATSYRGRFAPSAEPRPVAGKKERPPHPTTISLSPDGTMLVSTNPLNTKPFPRDQVDLVFGEMLSREVMPPLVLRCNPGVTQGMLMEILIKARDAGIQDIRLVVSRELEKP